MLDKNLAREKVRKLIANVRVSENDQLIILDEMTIEKPYGWIFFYTSKGWHETGDMRYAIAGNGPVVVEKENGTVRPLTSALPHDVAIREYENRFYPNK